jgi:Fur family ferric uptake transcriptional regulator
MIASTQTNHPMAISQQGQKIQSAIEQACACLKRAGLRITQPRISILTSLINRSVPARIEQIHADLPPDTCDLVTVYRCLATFQEIGLVRLSYFHNGSSAYQIALNADELQPYHVISRKDNEVQELDVESTAELRAVIAKIEERLRASGNGRVSHIVEFFVDNVAVPTQAPDFRDAGRMEELPAALEMRNAAPVSIPSEL